MEIQHLRRPPLRRRKVMSSRSSYLHPEQSNEEEFFDAQDHFEDKEPLKSRFTHYAVLFLKVGLWLGFAWVLSYLHLGVPCFLLPVILLLYSMLVQRESVKSEEASKNLQKDLSQCSKDILKWKTK